MVRHAFSRSLAAPQQKMNGLRIVGRARLPNYRETINSISNLCDGGIRKLRLIRRAVGTSALHALGPEWFIATRNVGVNMAHVGQRLGASVTSHALPRL